MENKSVTIRGKTYPSQIAAARALGVSRQRISQIVNKKERPRKERSGFPTVIRGVLYPSQSAAARALGVSANSVSHGLNNGTLNNVGMGRNYQLKKPVRVDGIEFESITDAAKHIGVSRGTLSQVLIKNRKQYKGRIIEYAASVD